MSGPFSCYVLTKHPGLRHSSPMIAGRLTRIVWAYLKLDLWSSGCDVRYVEE